jgi:hypothetical protein
MYTNNSNINYQLGQNFQQVFSNQPSLDNYSLNQQQFYSYNQQYNLHGSQQPFYNNQIYHHQPFNYNNYNQQQSNNLYQPPAFNSQQNMSYPLEQQQSHFQRNISLNKSKSILNLDEQINNKEVIDSTIIINIIFTKSLIN